MSVSFPGRGASVSPVTCAALKASVVVVVSIVLAAAMTSSA